MLHSASSRVQDQAAMSKVDSNPGKSIPSTINEGG